MGGDLEVRVAGRNIPLDVAETRVLRYCTNTHEVRWASPKDAVGARPVNLQRGAFAYRTYDCVPADAGHILTTRDILVADGLNAMMRAKDVAAALSVVDPVSVEIEALDEAGSIFW